MTLLKNITHLLKSNQGLLCLGVLVVVIVVVSQYSKQLGLSRAGYNNAQSADEMAMMQKAHPQMGQAALKAMTTDQYPGESAPAMSTMAVTAAMPSGMNSGPGSVTGIQTVTSGVPQSCLNQQVANPSDLLPKDSNSGWAAQNPRGAGELMNVNLLKAGQLAGIDTVGGTLRNANLQLRSEPPNPKAQVSPWSNSTIEPDLMRVPLELGCGPQ